LRGGEFEFEGLEAGAGGLDAEDRAVRMPHDHEAAFDGLGGPEDRRDDDGTHGAKASAGSTWKRIQRPVPMAPAKSPVRRSARRSPQRLTASRRRCSRRRASTL